MFKRATIFKVFIPCLFAALVVLPSCSKKSSGGMWESFEFSSLSDLTPLPAVKLPLDSEEETLAHALAMPVISESISNNNTKWRGKILLIDQAGLEYWQVKFETKSANPRITCVASFSNSGKIMPDVVHPNICGVE